MHLITSETTDPAFNLALDEYLLKQSSEEFLILGINSASVISGKHQCIYKEIDTRYIYENKIPVLRRITGGGTVFHDEGNLNYTFILNSESGKQVDFPKYTRPVTGFLESIGLNAVMSGSDIKVDGKKISGNSEHVHRNRVLHHGTLLFNADLGKLRNSLRKDGSRYETRAVASKSSPVMNIKEIKPDIRDINEFRSLLTSHFLDIIPSLEKYVLNSSEISEIKQLAENKYNSWEWNFAYGPEYSFTGSLRLDDKEMSFRLYVREGIIRDIVLFGNIEQKVSLSELRGIRHMPDDFKKFFINESSGIIDVFDFF